MTKSTQKKQGYLTINTTITHSIPKYKLNQFSQQLNFVGWE